MRIKIILLLLVITSCSPRYKLLQEKKEQTLDSQHEVLILSKESNINLNSASFIGEIKGPFEKFYTPLKEELKGCGYTEIINDLKNRARQLGANIVKIIEINKPHSLEICYRIKAKFYRNFDPNLLENINNYNRLKNIPNLKNDADYALIHFYRPKLFRGSVVKYDIFMDDKIFVTKMLNGQKLSYKIFDFGNHTFSAKSKENTKKEISINIQRGQEYYIRCGIDYGRKQGNPQFSLLNNNIGFSEFNEMEEK